MRLPNFRRLFTQDYPKEFQKLIDTLSVSINNGIEVIYEALNNNLTLRDNIRCTVKDVLVTVNASGTPTQTTQFTLNTTNKVDGTTVISAINQTSGTTFPSGGVFVSGSQSANNYIINNITGLQANNVYLIRVIAWQS